MDLGNNVDNTDKTDFVNTELEVEKITKKYRNEVE